jgi:dihydroorotate dehydrogenase (NAD+) catalytic subunit
MLNTIGLQNYGVEEFIKKQLPTFASYGIPIIVGVFDKTAANYARVAKRLNKESVIAGLEVNLSCPNLEAGGKTFCDFPELVFEVIKKMRDETDLPLIAKLSPNTTDIVEIAQAAKEAGANGLSLINTLVGMRINTETRKPYLSKNTGGLSGPAIRPVAIAKIFAVVKVQRNRHGRVPD